MPTKLELNSILEEYNISLHHCFVSSINSIYRMSKKLINAPSQVVPEALEGLVLTNSNLKFVFGLNIAIRSDVHEFRKNHVTIISGGGSGHEPAHAGYIGEGMLSSAVLGNSFASPSVSAILAAIRICAGPKGVLLIVKNYTGDRLNFGMAAEKAKSEGINVRMTVVADDCALSKGKGITGGRGIAGTVLVHKIAGAAAKAGLSLEDVHEEANVAALLIATVGIALTTCTIPGCPPSNRLDGPIFELGMGIHGEPGREQRGLPEALVADKVADLMVDTILEAVTNEVTTDNSSLYISPENQLILLLNNLGSTPLIELYILIRRITNTFKSKGYNQIVRIYVGSFMTSFEMSGVSLSIMKVDEKILSRLDENTNAPAWISATVINADETLQDRQIPYDVNEYKNTKVEGGFVCYKAVSVVRAIVSKIIEIEPQLTQYDMICGDGDCGIVMKSGAEKVLEYINHNFDGDSQSVDSASFCNSLANAVSASMGGSSGALFEIMLRAMAAYLLSNHQSDSEIDKSWAQALKIGVTAIQTYGGASVGMRTMLDALVPSVDILASGGTIHDASVAARRGAEMTKNMVGLAGRSNYIQQEKMAGVPDPGAVAVAEALETVAALQLS